MSKLPIAEAYQAARFRQLLEAEKGGLDKSDLSTIVNLEPLWEQADQIAWPNGVDPADLHCTLCMLEYDEYDLMNLDAVRTTLQNMAYRAGAMHGTITGWGVIGKVESPAYVGLLSIPNLAEFRSDLVRELRKQGVEYKNNYDFLPHMTISYGVEPPRAFMDALRGRELTFQSIVLRIQEDVELFPFSKPEFVEAARTASGNRRDTTRPGGADWDPFLHPRNREGKFRNVANKIRDMQVGTHIDVFRFVKRAALPGVTSGRLIRTTTGYVLQVIKGKDAEQFIHNGPMAKDDLVDLIVQAEQGLDFSNLSIEERRDLGLPIGTRPGQGISEEGILRSEKATPRVDAVVMEQNGGLVVTGTDPANVAGNPDGEHWVYASWTIDEYDHYNLSAADTEYLTSRNHAIGYRTEPGGSVVIEYFNEPLEAKDRFESLRAKHGAPPETVRPNSDLQVVTPSAPPDVESPSGDSDSGSDAAVESVSKSPEVPSLPPEPQAEAQTPGDEVEPGDADDAPEAPVPTEPTPPMETEGNSGPAPAEGPDDDDPNTGGPETQDMPDEDDEPSLEGIQPTPTAEDDDPYGGEHPSNELYVALHKWAEDNTDEGIRTKDGEIRRITLNFDATTDEDPEEILGADFEIEGSAEVLADSYGAILWPNGLVTLYTEPEPLLSAWNRLKEQFGA